MVDRTAELRRFVEDIGQSDTLVVVRRRFVYPQDTLVRLPNPEDPRTASIEDLAVFLRIPHVRITEVFEYKGNEYLAEKRQPLWKSFLIKARLAHSEMETRETSPHYTGRFADQGKQRLADILGKTIEYYYQPTSAPIFDLIKKEVYSPTKVSE